jgi:hypothetical protein
VRIQTAQQKWPKYQAVTESSHSQNCDIGTPMGITNQIERAREVLILSNSIGKCYLSVLLASFLMLKK